MIIKPYFTFGKVILIGDHESQVELLDNIIKAENRKDSKIHTGFKIIKITQEVKINLRILFIFLEFV